MSSLLRNPKDFWTGVMFIAVGLATVLIARDYPMGTGNKMGAAYFPTVLGTVLGVIGLIALIRSLLKKGETVAGFALKPLLMVLVPTLAFGALIRGAGLIVCILILVLVSALASVRFRWSPSLLLAIGLAVFCSLVFVKALGLPIPIVGAWFGG